MKRILTLAVGVLSLAACSGMKPITTEQAAAVAASERKVGTALGVLAENGVCGPMFRTFMRLPVADQTAEGENAFIDSCGAVLGMASDLLPITATVYAQGEEWRADCAATPSAVYTDRSALLGRLHRKACAG